MMKDSRFSHWFFRASILAAGIVLGLSLFAGAAFAQTATTTFGGTSISSYDFSPPLIVNVDARESAYAGAATVEADFVDLESDVDADASSVSVTDAMVTGCQTSNRHVSCSAAGMRSGDHSLHVTVKDKYGNRCDREHHFTIVDKVPPVIDSITATAQSVGVKYHDPSPSSGIASVTVLVDGVKLNCDISGSGCSDDDDDYYEDSEHHQHHSDGYYHDSDSDDHEGSNSIGYVCPIDFNLTCGTHQVSVTVTDKAGNATTGTSTINAGDCTPPATTDNAPAGWQKTDVTVSLTCTDTGSGCASTTYEIDGGATQTGNSVSLTTDGVHTITYRSTDNAGNVETTKTATVMIDKTPPAITTSGDVTVEAAGPDGSAVSYTSNGSDATSGLASFGCSPASGSTFPLGPTVVNCTAIDVAGNSATSTLTVNVVDTTPPVLTLPGNFKVAATGTTGVGIFSASATDIVDGTVPVVCSAASGDSFAIGDTTVDCTATDSHGNTSTGSFVITVCQSGRPLIDQICPTVFGSADFFWKDQAARIMTIRYTMVNGAGTDAYNVIMTGSTANNGVITMTPMPLAVGDIAANTSVKVAIDYYVPVGVHSFTAVNTACADDQCGTTYYYPVVP